MQDRVSQYPGRVKLTPVSGQENVYDMEWADGATVAGTPLNKANLLTDSTASRFGLSSSATVNQVFGKLYNAAIVSGSTVKKPNGTSITIPASSVSGIADAVFVTGTYTGDDSETRTISLGFKAGAVLIEVETGLRNSSTSNIFGGLVLQDYPLIAGYGGAEIVEITSSGFRINNGSPGKVGNSHNQDGTVYYYIAFK